MLRKSVLYPLVQFRKLTVGQAQSAFCFFQFSRGLNEFVLCPGQLRLQSIYLGLEIGRQVLILCFELAFPPD